MCKEKSSHCIETQNNKGEMESEVKGPRIQEI